VIYFCCEERRRNAVKEQTLLNGIDFLEVSDDPAQPVETRQRTLFVYFIHDLPPGALTKEQVRIDGGERIRDIRVTSVDIGVLSSPPIASPPGFQGNALVVQVAEPGDFSTYTLRLVRSAEDTDPPDGFDPMLSAVDFSFKVACPSDFDCRPAVTACPAEAVSPPAINYLAKDYASFRQLMLDRMASLMPQGLERNAADVGVTLVEMLAYVGDHLSYQQDAVATEAYLGTARRRISVQRHARLVDYDVHDGSNARAWVQVLAAPSVSGAVLTAVHDGRPARLLTQIEGQTSLIQPGTPAHQRALAANPVVFELMHDVTLVEAHNELKFYTWSALDCCLPSGATRATLSGAYPHLAPGDVLVFTEKRGPHTGEPEDANPAHRHAVRLTKVTPALDPLVPFASPPDASPPPASPPGSSPPGFGTPVTQIEWHTADALPFPLCVSARAGSDYYDDVSVALGNIVLADHGLTIDGEAFDPVPEPNPALTRVSAAASGRCDGRTVSLTPPRFQPRLAHAPLTQAAAYSPQQPPESAAATMRPAANTVLPLITLTAPATGVEVWRPTRDLLSGHSADRAFVVEVESDGAAYLRFGDGQFGARPVPQTQFIARYRTGNGVRGNVAAESLQHLVTADPAISDQVVAGVRNPLPAVGGVEPESIEHVRQDAPSAFRTQERAVTPDDYAAAARRCSADVQRAAATFRWTGSWRTVFLTVDRLGGQDVDDRFERDVRHCMERYRMAGHDLEVDGPRYVSLEIEMMVCVTPGYSSSDVRAALQERFSNRTRRDGRLGLFHPDNFTFGQTVFLSAFYAAAQAVAGVDSIEITKFRRQGVPGSDALASGALELGRLEIARLDNDPDFPERGVFSLIMRGGR